MSTTIEGRRGLDRPLDRRRTRGRLGRHVRRRLPDRRGHRSPRSRAAATPRSTPPSPPRAARSPRGPRCPPKDRAAILHAVGRRHREARARSSRPSRRATTARCSGRCSGVVMPRVGAQLPLLRRRAARARRHDDFDTRGHTNHVSWDPAGRRRRHHAVERAADARDVAARAGAGGREHRGAQAAGVGAAHRVDARRHRARGRPARRRVQRRAGHRRGGRRRAASRTPTSTASRSPARSPPASCVAAAAGAEPHARLASSSAASRRSWSFADADLDAPSKQAAGQFDNAGQVCLAGHAAAGRGRSCTTSSSNGSLERAAAHPAGRPARRRRPTSGR